jgi:hypothetical protein
VRLLLGADLESHPTDERGWGAIVGSEGRPTGPAHFVKVPHHGSENAHDDRMWTDLLVPEPHAAITPFSSGGTPLPRDTDIERIAALTPNAWLTRQKAAAGSPNRPSAVTRTVKEVVRNIESISVEPGRVTLRCLAADPTMWTVDAPAPAIHLGA